MQGRSKGKPAHPGARLGPWLWVLALLASGACSTPRLARHGRGSFWSRGFSRQVKDPLLSGPALALTASLPVLAVQDQRLSDLLRRDPILTSGKASAAAPFLFGLGGVAAATAALDLTRGDRGESLEVLAESLLATEGVVEVLKVTTGRQRPGDSSSHHSFPSSEAAFSFASATFVAQRFADAVEGGTRALGLLAYVPAVFVAVNRVESGRHFPTDVAAGALIGTWITGWIDDAHRVDEERRSAELRRGLQCEVLPATGPDWVGVMVQLRF